MTKSKPLLLQQTDQPKDLFCVFPREMLEHLTFL